MKRPRIVTVVLVLFGLLALGSSLYALRHYRAAMATLYLERHPVGDADRELAQRLLGAYSEVAFRTDDDLLLRGWYAPGRDGAVVVFVHGGGGNRAQFLGEAGELARRGIGVLLYDARASGDSGGTTQTWGDRERRDLAAAFDFVDRQAGVDPARLGLQGFSIGGTTAALFASADPRVHALLLNATWPSLRDELYAAKSGHFAPLLAPFVLRGFARAGVAVDQLRPIDRIAAIAPRPLLVISGTADRDTPPEQICALYARAGAPKALHFVPGAGHGGYVEAGGADYLRRVGDFFAWALATGHPDGAPPGGDSDACAGPSAGH